MGQSLQAGKVVQIVPKSLAKNLGSPYVAADALAMAQKHPEHYVLVSDKEAFEAGVFLLERAKLNTELAASCTLAAARRVHARFGKADHVVLLLCGGNNSLENWIHYKEVLGG
jgi:threonine dehydratase